MSYFLDLVASRTPRSLAWRTLLAIAAACAGLVLRLVLPDAVHLRSTYATFYPMIVVAAVFGRAGPASLAVVLAVIFANTIVSPLSGWIDAAGIALFLTSCTLIILVAETVHVAYAQVLDVRLDAQKQADLMAFVDQAPPAIAMFDSDMRYIAASRRWLASHRLENDVAGLSHFDIFPDMPERWKEICRRALKGESVRSEKDTFQRKDGSVQWLRWEARPWYRTPGEIAGIIIFSDDITAEVTAEAALRDSRSRLQSVVDTAPLSIVVIDHRGLIQSANRATETMFGFSQSELEGKNLGALIPGISALAGKDSADPYGAGKPTVVEPGREIEGRRKDGSKLDLNVSIGEWSDDQGHRFFSDIMQDISARKSAERKIVEMQAELLHVARLSAMGQMAAVLVHELNQPLAAMRLLMDAARKVLDAGQERDITSLKRTLELSSEQATRAIQIIAQMRRFAAHGDAQELAEEHVAPLLREAVTLGRLTGAKRSAKPKITLHVAEDLPPIFVNHVQIVQVLLNLIHNAVEAVADSPRREIDVGAAQRGGNVEIRVADSGPGIALEVAAKLFQPFVTTKAEGVGLGLSICRSIIESQHGRIWTEPNPGGGAIFCIALPAGGTRVPSS